MFGEPEPVQLFTPDVAVLDSVPTPLAVVQIELFALQVAPVIVQESVIVLVFGAHVAVIPVPLQA